MPDYLLFRDGAIVCCKTIEGIEQKKIVKLELNLSHALSNFFFFFVLPVIYVSHASLILTRMAQECSSEGGNVGLVWLYENGEGQDTKERRKKTWERVWVMKLGVVATHAGTTDTHATCAIHVFHMSHGDGDPLLPP